MGASHEEYFDRHYRPSFRDGIAEPAMFGPEDFHIFGWGVAERLADAWFKGRIVLANRAQVEDPSFHSLYNIGLVVSGNSGFIHERGGFWFFYAIYAWWVRIRRMRLQFEVGRGGLVGIGWGGFGARLDFLKSRHFPNRL